MTTRPLTFRAAFTREALAASRRFLRFRTVSGTAGNFDEGALVPLVAGATFLAAVLALQQRKKNFVEETRTNNVTIRKERVKKPTMDPLKL